MDDLNLVLLTVFASIASAVLLFSIKKFGFIDDIKGSRNVSMDSARYFFAAFVFFHHSGYFYNYFGKDDWSNNSIFLVYIGKLGVCAFFVLTAYLFWGKVRKADNVDWVSLYKFRFLRIAPLSFFSSMAAITYILFNTGIPQDLTSFFYQASWWFDGGIADVKPNINGFDRSYLVLSAVTWSLQWEWAFYFLLPVLYIFRRNGFEISIALVLVCHFILPYTQIAQYSGMLSYFAVGMLCRECVDKVKISSRKSDIIMLISVAIILIYQPDFFSIKLSLMVGIFVFCICSGGSLFGLMKITGAVRLGQCSYSIYLLQGLVLYPGMKFLNSNGVYADKWYFYLCLYAGFLSLCLLSSLTYHFIERRFYEGKLHKITVSGR